MDQQGSKSQVDEQKQRLQSIIKQTTKSQIITSKPAKEQIVILNEEINKIDNDKNLTNDQKQYYKNEYQQKLLTKLRESGDAKSIPHINQNIEISNPDLLILIKRLKLRAGFDSIIRVFGQDQSCIKVRNTDLDYDKIVNNEQLLEQTLIEFKGKLSTSLKIPFDQIEILGVSKGSFEISFQIKGKTIEEIQLEIQNNPNAQTFLNEYCNGIIEYLAYFDLAKANSRSKVAISLNDFNPQYNMTWEGFKEKEQRGPFNNRYDYYFPKGCFGFGLNVKKYGDNQDWIQMNGNPNEWRIMYHGIKNYAVNSIIQNNLIPGQGNACALNDCIDEFGKTVKVGNGIYFSNDYNVCIKDGYANYVQVCNKQFAPILMSRVNPKKIRQGGDYMIKKQYFVVNNSIDVRPYRILLHEKKQ
ncbi:unnamed protein product [Paramecium primaurelia]|uniref:Uncharacterized protein n=1 Tax=Paramecium primaurelia TaxID=5886 RepID=A0A8S1P8K7_PARPR|nr:unnamed protein product [Paramecium primaurelia]